MKIFPLYFPAGGKCIGKKMPGLEKVRREEKRNNSASVTLKPEH